MERRADIVGTHHTRFGRLDGETVDSLLTRAEIAAKNHRHGVDNPDADLTSFEAGAAAWQSALSRAGLVDEGWAHEEGRLPVNPSGGLKSKGHPIGATGVSQHVLAARQLLGAAGANYASVLGRVR